jgi:hypothetical protein
MIDAIYAQTNGFLFVVFVISGDEFFGRPRSFCCLGQCALEDRGCHPRAHLVLVTRQSEQGCAGPEDIGGRRMCVAFGCVQEEVTDSGAGDMLRLLRHVGEDDSISDLWAGPHERCLLEIGLAQVWKSQKPQDGFGQALQNSKPGSEGRRLDLYLG